MNDCTCDIFEGVKCAACSAVIRSALDSYGAEVAGRATAAFIGLGSPLHKDRIQSEQKAREHVEFVLGLTPSKVSER